MRPVRVEVRGVMVSFLRGFVGVWIIGRYARFTIRENPICVLKIAGV
jgi:hypothetical protein